MLLQFSPQTVHARELERTTLLYLHGKEVTIKNGRTQPIYGFARQAKADGLDILRDGSRIKENARTGLPYLKRA